MTQRVIMTYGFTCNSIGMSLVIKGKEQKKEFTLYY